MDNQEKQHRRGFKYIYKGGIGNQRKKELEHVVEQGKKSNSLSWLQRISRIGTLNVENGGLRSLDIGKETPPTERGGIVEARKSTSWLELGSREGPVEGRKSVSSCIETEARRIIVEEGRNSVSHIKTNSSKAGGFAEARKSVSQTETLSYELKHLKVKVLVSDMPSFMQVHAFRCAKRTYDSLEKFSSKHIAHNIKKEFDKAYGPVWHCIVGSNFGSFVTHSTGGFLYFSIENLYILLFKTKVKKVLD